MLILQSNHFKKTLRKLLSKNSGHKLILDNAIKQIIAAPDIGELKKGDLAGVYVYKFKLDDILYLLAYTVQANSINLIYLHTHDNFYRDLKRVVN